MKTLTLLGTLSILFALGCGDQVTVTSGVCSEATACTDGLVCCADYICRGTCSDSDGSLLPEKDAGKAKDGGSDAGKVKDAGEDVGNQPDTGEKDVGIKDVGTEDVVVMPDTGTVDVGTADQGYEDAETPDAGMVDAGPGDVGVADAGQGDTGNTPDAGSVCDNYSCGPGNHCEDHSGQPSCAAGCLTTKKDCLEDYTCINGDCVLNSCTKDTDCHGTLPFCTPSGKCGGCNGTSDGNTCSKWEQVCSLYMEPSQCVTAISNELCNKTCAKFTDCTGYGGCAYPTDVCVATCTDASTCGGLDCNKTAGICKCP